MLYTLLLFKDREITKVENAAKVVAFVNVPQRKRDRRVCGKCYTYFEEYKIYISEDSADS
jgi:hypothetical protein